MGPTRQGKVDAHRFAPAAPEEEYVYGASCPGWHTMSDHAGAIDDWITFMQDRGIERVCCLLSGDQLAGTDANTDAYRDVFGPERVRHVPIADHHLASVETLEEQIMPFLFESVERGEPVVVHCLAGIGRTGHVLAAWLVSGRDYDVVDAIETVEEMGRSPAEAIESGNARRGELYELLDEFA